jgi:hypothetical protein
MVLDLSRAEVTTYISCITTIDTIIHHILTKHTNDAYIYDTPTGGGLLIPLPLGHPGHRQRGVREVGHEPSSHRGVLGRSR